MNHRSNWQHPLDHQKSKRVPEKHLFLLYWLCQNLVCVVNNKLWNILQEMRIPRHLICLQKNLYTGQEATVRSVHGTIDWFQIGKGVCQGSIFSPWLGEFWGLLYYVWDDCNCSVVWAFFGIAFLWDWNKNWPFPVLWPLLSFPNFHFHSIIFQDSILVLSRWNKWRIDLTMKKELMRWDCPPNRQMLITKMVKTKNLNKTKHKIHHLESKWKKKLEKCNPN